MAKVGRNPRHGIPKEKTRATVPEGYKEWLLRYSERAYSIHDGVSRAIYEFVRIDMGARYIMSQIIEDGLVVPDDIRELVAVSPGEESMIRRLHENTTPDAKRDDVPGQAGAPTYYGEKLTRIDLMALPGELAFLEKISREMRRSRSKGLRILVQELIRLDDVARSIMLDICTEGKWWLPDHICQGISPISE